MPIGGVDAVREQLFELVDDEQAGSLRRENRRMHCGSSRSCVAVGAACVPVSRSSWWASSFIASAPGVKIAIGQCWLPGNAPAAMVGTSPARSSDDLPLPDGPPITSVRRGLQPRDEFVDQRFAAEEERGVLGLERGQALVRAGGSRRARRGIPP